jgi:hypothetical protein
LKPRRKGARCSAPVTARLAKVSLRRAARRRRLGDDRHFTSVAVAALGGWDSNARGHTLRLSSGAPSARVGRL